MIVEGDALAWSWQVGALEPIGGSLFVAKQWEPGVVVLDGAASGPPKLVSRYVPKSVGYLFHFLEEWPALALVSREAIELVSLDDPARPRLLALHEFEVGWQRALTVMGTDLYVTHENGVAWLDPKSGKPQHLFDVPGDEFFRSYPTGLAHHGEWLFVAGRHGGLHAYRRKAQREFEHVRAVKRTYTPTRLQWWVPGRVLLLVGNEDVIAVDVSKPETMKASTSCKLKRAELETPLVKLSDDRAFAAGHRLRSKQVIFGTVDLANPLAPKLLSEDVVDAADGADLRDAGCLRVGSQVFVASVYLERMRIFAPARVT
ncbi:MAG: hypothetical protein U0228_16780 [Myxococcaceae bacterium]